MRREESGYVFKAIILSWGNKHSEGWSCALWACYKQELHVIYFHLKRPSRTEPSTVSARTELQPGPLNPGSCVIYKKKSGEGGSTQENKHGRSGPTRLTVQGQPWVTLCGASSPAQLENGTLPSFVNPPSCCDVSRRSSVLTFLFQTTSEPCRCGHLQTKENTQGKQAGVYLTFTPKLTQEYQCDRQHPLPFLLCW